MTKNDIPWTRFSDMHSGGGLKEKWQYIYIQAPVDEAVVVFYNRFKHNPYRVTCTCCGEDYSVRQYETLEEASDFERNRSPGYSNKPTISLEDYLKQDDVLLIKDEDIKQKERTGTVPSQGYVWVD